MDVRMIESFEAESTAEQMAVNSRKTTLKVLAHQLNCTEAEASQYLALRSQYMLMALAKDGRVRAGKGYLSAKGEFLKHPGEADRVMGLSYDRIPTTVNTNRDVPESTIQEYSARIFGTSMKPDQVEEAYRNAVKVLLKNFTGVWYEGIGLVTKTRWITSNTFMTALPTVK